MALSRLAGTAGRIFKKYPLACNSTIYGTFYVAAEFSQQRFNHKYSPEHPPMNYAALPKFAFVGGCVYSPMLYFWYSRIIDKYLVGKTASLVLKKVVLDQGFMTPLLLIAFFTSMSVLEGKEDIFAELREKFVKTFLANQVFWIPAQTLNFLLVPAQYRVVYVATVSFVWINVLCWIKRQNPEHPPMNYAALPKFAFVGGCVYSPMLYFWYSRIIDKYLVGKTASLVLKKVVLDQGFMTPLLLIAFFTSMSVLEGKEDIFAELREKFVKTFLANQVFWIPAQTLNFLLVPAQYRVVYVATVSFVWINVLCWIKRQNVKKEFVTE